MSVCLLLGEPATVFFDNTRPPLYKYDPVGPPVGFSLSLYKVPLSLPFFLSSHPEISLSQWFQLLFPVTSASLPLVVAPPHDALLSPTNWVLLFASSMSLSAVNRIISVES